MKNYIISGFAITQEMGIPGVIEIELTPNPDNTLTRMSHALKAQEYLNKTIECSLSDWKFKGQIWNTKYSSENNSITLSVRDHLAVLDNVERSQVFTLCSFGDIVYEMITECDTVFLDKSNEIDIKLAIQYKESDLEFLRRLASQIGVQIWFSGSSIYIGAKGHEGTEELILNKDIVNLEIDTSLGSEDISIQALPYNEGGQTTAEETLPESSLGPINDSVVIKRRESQIISQHHLFIEDHEFNETELYARQVLRKYVQNRIFAQGVVFEPLQLGTPISLRETDANSEFHNKPESLIVKKFCAHWSLGQKKPYYTLEAINEDALTCLLPGYGEPVNFISPAAVEKSNDKLNRVKVVFPWDPRKEMSPWLRMLSGSWGRHNFQYLPPRAGDNVLVLWNRTGMDPIVLGSISGGEYVEDTDKDIVFSINDGRQVIFGKDSIVIENTKGNSKLEILKDKINIHSKNVLIKTTRLEIE